METKGTVLNTNELSAGQKGRMFELMCMFFNGVEKDKFSRDLSEKKWVVVLQDTDSGEIFGFSTQTILEERIDSTPVKVIFSGDTIVHRDYRFGEKGLMKAWAELVSSLMIKYQGVKFYWYLISMGYRTYRFLPVFFKEFYPRYDKETPEFEKKVIDAFASSKYPDEYDSKMGIIHTRSNGYLKPGVGDITEELLKDQHIEFFVKRNPLHAEGEELACIAELVKDNLNPVAFRMLSKDNPLRFL